MYQLAYFPFYLKKLAALSPDKRRRAKQIEDALEIAVTGRPLRYDFFREKRLNGERMLFLIYEEEKTILLITISDKKTQQQDIDYVMERLEQLRAFISR
jgi:mRNA-degrading endonuclease RelE of RelBE toxin-antitoxin system